jgi:glycosyltransferase involved in cell wall biosynthesis
VKETSLRSIAIAIVRNCADIVAFSVLNSILLGVDQCAVIDNGSKDGTLELLTAMAKKLPRLRVIADPSPYQQEKLVGAVINEYTRAAKTIVIPFDSDEFWDVPVRKLAAYFERGVVNILSCNVVNFIQSRMVTNPTRFSWLSARGRASVVAGHAASMVRDHAISFVEMEFPRKVLFQAEGPIALGRGAHSVEFPGSQAEICDGFSCLHLPIRSRQALSIRAYDYAPRIAPFRRGKEESWQSAYFHEMLNSNMITEEWRANSYDRSGSIDVYGAKRRIRYDNSLIMRIGRAYAYGLLLNIPMRLDASKDLHS